MAKKTLLIKNGTLVDPLSNQTPTGDIRIENGRISEIGPNLKAGSSEKVLDVEGKLVMPGLVDMHVHFDRCPYSHAMLARAGVTTALSLSDLPENMLELARDHGNGIRVGYVCPLTPGGTVSGTSPSAVEIGKVIDYALTNGAMGIKVIGGHYPLTPAAMGRAIKGAHRHRCWVGVHAGSTKTPGDVCGMAEVAEQAAGLPVHIAHINSYCRGIQTGSPLDEAKMAVDILENNPNCISESYLALINGTSGRFENGIPASKVTCRSLIQGGFTADMKGMEEAILAGWALVHEEDAHRREVYFPEPAKALELFRQKKTQVRLSFKVNSPVSAISLALARKKNGNYAVDALSTDGGSIPRNITLHQGLCLVEYGAFTLNQFIWKAALAPARLLGLKDVGYLAAGAAADVIIVDRQRYAAEVVIADGKIVVDHGKLLGRGSRIMGTEQARKVLDEYQLPLEAVYPEWLNQ